MTYRTGGGKRWRLLFWQATRLKGDLFFCFFFTWGQNRTQSEFIFIQLRPYEWQLKKRWLLTRFEQNKLLSRWFRLQKNNIIVSNLFIILEKGYFWWSGTFLSFCFDSAAKNATYKAIQEFLNQIARLVKLLKHSRGSFALRSQCLLNRRLTLTQSAEHSN